MFIYLTRGTNRHFHTFNLNPSAKYYSTKRYKFYSKETRNIYVNFIKALLNNKLNLNKKEFKKYDEIINYLEKYNGEKIFTRHYISQLKNTGGNFEKIPLTPESKEFINYVKHRFPNFNESKFTYALTKQAPKTTKQSKQKLLLNSTWFLSKIKQILLLFKTYKFISLLRSILLLKNFYIDIAYFFIQLPYLVLFWLYLLDNPDMTKDLSNWLSFEFSDEYLDIEFITPYEFIDFSKIVPKYSDFYDELIPLGDIDNPNPESANTSLNHTSKELLFEPKTNSSWWFPMLDFNNLKYFPSLFDNSFGTNNTYTLFSFNPQKIYAYDIFNYKTDNHELALVENNNLQIQNTNITKSLSFSDKGSTFSKYFYYLDTQEAHIKTTIIKQNNLNLTELTLQTKPDLSLSTYNIKNNKQESIIPHRITAHSLLKPIRISLGFDLLNIEIPNRNSQIKPLDPFRFSLEYDEVFGIDTPLPRVNPTPIRPLHLESYYLDAEIDNSTSSKANNLSNTVLNKANITPDDLIKTKESIEETNRQIYSIKSQFIDFQDKINKLDKQISDLTTEKLNLTRKFNKGYFSKSDKDSLKNTIEFLNFINETKTKLVKDFESNNNLITKLEENKSSLIKQFDQLQNELGYIAITPTT
jgi:hypothetical protein